jgi:hypothetical protein
MSGGELLNMGVTERRHEDDADRNALLLYRGY